MAINDYNAREMTERNLREELDRVADGYMNAYDEYEKTMSRDSAFLKDATDAILGISSCLYVYNRDKMINPRYAVEKLSVSKMLIESALNYYKGLLGDDE